MTGSLNRQNTFSSLPTCKEETLVFEITQFIDHKNKVPNLTSSRVVSLYHFCSLIISEKPGTTRTVVRQQAKLIAANFFTRTV